VTIHGAIIAEILSGISDHENVVVEPNRKAAIALALKEQESGDVVVILGKGDETTQIIYDQHLPFDDREVVRSLLSTAS